MHTKPDIQQNEAADTMKTKINPTTEDEREQTSEGLNGDTSIPR